jgi:hypothetical protein
MPKKQNRLAYDVGYGYGRIVLGVGIRPRQDGATDRHRLVEQPHMFAFTEGKT